MKNGRGQNCTLTEKQILESTRPRLCYNWFGYLYDIFLWWTPTILLTLGLFFTIIVMLMNNNIRGSKQKIMVRALGCINSFLCISGIVFSMSTYEGLDDESFTILSMEVAILFNRLSMICATGCLVQKYLMWHMLVSKSVKLDIVNDKSIANATKQVFVMIMILVGCGLIDIIGLFVGRSNPDLSYKITTPARGLLLLLLLIITIQTARYFYKLRSMLDRSQIKREASSTTKNLPPILNKKIAPMPSPTVTSSVAASRTTADEVQKTMLAAKSAPNIIFSSVDTEGKEETPVTTARSPGSHPSSSPITSNTRQPTMVRKKRVIDIMRIYVIIMVVSGFLLFSFALLSVPKIGRKNRALVFFIHLFLRLPPAVIGLCVPMEQLAIDRHHDEEVLTAATGHSSAAGASFILEYVKK
jgi:hypothetical protein